MKKSDMLALIRLINKYNVLACPKEGVPKLTARGNISKVGFKVRKDRTICKHKNTIEEPNGLPSTLSCKDCGIAIQK